MADTRPHGAPVTAEELRAGMSQLAELAQAEYREPLENVIAPARESPDRVAARVGRLIGVAMKEPFADATNLDTPSAHSAAYRTWQLRDAQSVEKQRETWQYATLDYLKTDASVGRGTFHSVHAIAEDAHYESGFFGHLAASARAYICGNADIRKKVEENIDKAKKAGLNVTLSAPEVVVGSGGVALGSYLVTAVPVLGFVGVPVIAGIVLLLYTIGIDAFCSWTASSAVRGAESSH